MDIVTASTNEVYQRWRTYCSGWFTVEWLADSQFPPQATLPEKVFSISEKTEFESFDWLLSIRQGYLSG